MKKKSFFSLGLVALGLPIMSGLAFATPRADRVMNDPVLTAVEKSFESKYGVTCLPILENNISWRCLNGAQCGYTLTVTCPDRSHGLEIGGWELVVEGYDDGTKNDLDSVQFVRLR